MNAKTITEIGLAALVREVIAAGGRVTAPVRADDGTVDYRPITGFAEAALGAGLPRRSLKELFLPPTEPLFRWRQGRGDVTVEEVPVSFAPHLILGARPCDAGALEILDRVMGWDYRDELWFGRRAAATIVALACPDADGSCFCATVGLGPQSRRGADLFLTPAPGGFRVDAVTEKGEALIVAHATRFADAPGPATARDVAGPALAGVSLADVGEWLRRNHEHTLWAEVALRCHGCGACAAVCPTCHCFDIVDEPEGVSGGVRRRNWDTCQTARFTVHASGHNPRPDQGARARQRLTHKFSIYPTRFGEVLCTGCGRCARACPGGVDLPELLRTVAGLAGGERREGGGAA